MIKKLKKFSWIFLWFLFFIFLFDRGLYYVLFRLEQNLYSKNKFEQRFEKFMEGRSYDTLILGTSRAYEGIHPYYFSERLGISAYKETFRGKGPKYNYYFYQLYKKYAGIPKVVIYGVDYFVFNITSDPKWMARFKARTPKDTFKIFESPLLLLSNKNKIDNFHNNLMIRLKEKNDPDQNTDSFKDIIDIQTHLGIEHPDKKINTDPSGKFGRQVFPRYPGKEGKYLDMLIEELSRDGVTVILVGLPDYIGSYKTNYERRKFQLQLKTYRRDFKNVHILNYNRPRRFPLSNVGFFSDGGYGQTNSHLSKKGAELFCNLLIEDIREFYR